MNAKLGNYDTYRVRLIRTPLCRSFTIIQFLPGQTQTELDQIRIPTEFERKSSRIFASNKTGPTVLYHANFFFQSPI